MSSMDLRANIVAAIAPRFDPDCLASWQEYSRAFLASGSGPSHTSPGGRNLHSRQSHAARSWPPSQFLMSCGVQPSLVSQWVANLLVEDRFSALICFANTLGKDAVTAEQIHIFEAVLPHLIRAVRISRRLLGNGAHACGSDGAARHAATGRPAGRYFGQVGSRQRRRKGDAPTTAGRNCFWTRDVSAPTAAPDILTKDDRVMRPNHSRTWRPRRRT